MSNFLKTLHSTYEIINTAETFLQAPVFQLSSPFKLICFKIELLNVFLFFMLKYFYDF